MVGAPSVLLQDRAVNDGCKTRCPPQRPKVNIKIARTPTTRIVPITLTDIFAAYQKITHAHLSPYLPHPHYHHLLLILQTPQQQSPTKTTMSPSHVLSDRDVNTSAPTAHHPATADKPVDAVVKENNNNKPKTMEYHRQMLQSRLEEDEYVVQQQHQYQYLS